MDGPWVAYLSSGADSALAHVVDNGPFYAVDWATKVYENKAAVGGRGLVEVPDERGSKPIDISTGKD